MSARVDACLPPWQRHAWVEGRVVGLEGARVAISQRCRRCDVSRTRVVCRHDRRQSAGWQYHERERGTA